MCNHTYKVGIVSSTWTKRTFQKIFLSNANKFTFIMKGLRSEPITYKTLNKKDTVHIIVKPVHNTSYYGLFINNTCIFHYKYCFAVDLIVPPKSNVIHEVYSEQ